MSFPGVRALDGVDFDVGPGEVHGLIGENGAGKSTLIKVLSGEVTSYEGDLRLDGQAVDVELVSGRFQLGGRNMAVEIIRDIGDRLVMFDHGRVIEEGHPEAMLSEPKEPRTQEFLRAVIERA